MANEYCKQCHKSVYHKCERIYGADVPPCAKAVVENCHSTQQLKAEIAAFVHTVVANQGECLQQNVDNFIERMRQLSAV